MNTQPFGQIDIQATIECAFTLKRIRDMTRTYSQEFNPFWRWHRNSLCSLFANNQKILLSRWLHPKLISRLKFLSNCKTMFWVISQEQHSIRTFEFTETNSYFYSFTYGKKTYLAVHLTSGYRFFVNLLADRKAVDSTPKYYLLAGDTNQASFFLLA